jgi:hypothetical protein
MNERMLQLALQKQRLQLQSASQREAIATAAMGIAPLFAAADAVRDGAMWLRRHPEWLAGVVVALAVARPRRVFRWAGRVFLMVRAWRGLRDWQPGIFQR